MKKITCETTYTVHVHENKAGMRLDKLLSEEVEGLSRARLKGLMEDGHVFVGDLDGAAVMDGKKKARVGDVYIICVPPAVAAEPEAQNIPLDVVYEDDDVIVIDKPPGLVVHPAAGNADGTLVNALLAHCKGSLSGIGGVARPGIVHRLDKGTGGLMVAAKNDAAHTSLSEQFADHSLDRAYYALVWGVPKPLAGEIEGHIGRSPQNRKKMAVVERGGKYALTRYKVLKAFGTVASLVECRLATGRTHQIRVHLTSIGHPLIGDPLYGGGGRSRRSLLNDAARARVDALDHQALYAFELGFTHPRTGLRVLNKKKIPLFIKEIMCELEKV
ncbi:RluA family pseudouridine synthase [Magnetovibrio sp.]|uniref:RluA family pseudouridine synthase n=1 Tax=Magnetovibrio sp. TaxID=2024836 RepID=UPI002F934BB2